MRRPERFVPLSVRFATRRTGVAILRKFGLEGLAVWVCFLVACKDNRPEGEISYASEPEGWSVLGIPPECRPNFTLDEFFTFMGKVKKTRRRRVGHTFYVSCTSWERWSDIARREYERERKSRKRVESNRDNNRISTGTRPGQPPGQKSDLEREGEYAPRKRNSPSLRSAESSAADSLGSATPQGAPPRSPAHRRVPSFACSECTFEAPSPDELESHVALFHAEVAS